MEPGQDPILTEIYGLCRDLGEVENEMAALSGFEKEKKDLRIKLSVLVAQYEAQHGEAVVIPDFGKLMITKVNTKSEYDADALDQMVETLIHRQDEEWVSIEWMIRAINDCRSEKPTGGSLMIIKNKRRKHNA